MHTISRIFLLSLLLMLPPLARALPPQAEADMLMQEIGTSMKAGNYTGLPEKFQRVASLKARLPDSFEYHWGKTAFETRDYEGAMSHLDRYISSAGSHGKYYEDALAIYSRAKERIAQLQRDRQARQEKYEADLKKYQQAYEQYQKDLSTYGQREAESSGKLQKCQNSFENSRQSCNESCKKKYDSPLWTDWTGLGNCQKWCATQFDSEKCRVKFPSYPEKPVLPVKPDV